MIHCSFMMRVLQLQTRHILYCQTSHIFILVYKSGSVSLCLIIINNYILNTPCFCLCYLRGFCILLAIYFNFLLIVVVNLLNGSKTNTKRCKILCTYTYIKVNLYRCSNYSKNVVFGRCKYTLKF